MTFRPNAREEVEKENENVLETTAVAEQPLEWNHSAEINVF